MSSTELTNLNSISAQVMFDLKKEKFQVPIYCQILTFSGSIYLIYFKPDAWNDFNSNSFQHKTIRLSFYWNFLVNFLEGFVNLDLDSSMLAYYLSSCQNNIFLPNFLAVTINSPIAREPNPISSKSKTSQETKLKKLSTNENIFAFPLKTNFTFT